MDIKKAMLRGRDLLTFGALQLSDYSSETNDEKATLQRSLASMVNANKVLQGFIALLLHPWSGRSYITNVILHSSSLHKINWKNNRESCKTTEIKWNNFDFNLKNNVCWLRVQW